MVDDFSMKDEYVQRMFGPAHPKLRSISVFSKFSFIGFLLDESKTKVTFPGDLEQMLQHLRNVNGVVKRHFDETTVEHNSIKESIKSIEEDLKDL